VFFLGMMFVGVVLLILWLLPRKSSSFVEVTPTKFNQVRRASHWFRFSHGVFMPVYG
jgi:hypothetical protein